jgi:hypothetical protein
MWLIRGQILTIGIRARSKIWSYACPGEATASASGRAIVGRRSDRVKMASTPSSARRRVIVFDGATWRGRQVVVVSKAVDEDDHWWERSCRGAVLGVSWRSSSGGVCVKESWACKLARWVGVVSASRRCVQVLVSVRIRCSWRVHVVLLSGARCDRGTRRENGDAPYVDKDQLLEI